MIGVFGADGFIGRHVTRGLVDEGLPVTAVARRFRTAPAAGVAGIHEADLRDATAVKEALVGVDTVVQLVGTSTPAQGNARSAEHIENDVLPQVQFLDQCVSAGVRRFIFASSGGTVYGPTPRGEVTAETAPTHPISSHGVTKLMVEHFIKLHGHTDDLDYVILRIANPYGPGQVFRRGQGLVPALIDRYRAGLPALIYGDGTAVRDYLYVGDLVRAVHAAATDPSPARLVLNVGTGEGRTVLEVVRAIEDVLDIEFDVEYVPMRESDVSSIALDITRIGQVYGWRPRVGFQEGLRRTLVENASRLVRVPGRVTAR